MESLNDLAITAYCAYRNKTFSDWEKLSEKEQFRWYEVVTQITAEIMTHMAGLIIPEGSAGFLAVQNHPCGLESSFSLAEEVVDLGDREAANLN